MICSCHAARPCEHRVAAVLAYQVARGHRQIAPVGVRSRPPQEQPAVAKMFWLRSGTCSAKWCHWVFRGCPARPKHACRTLSLSAHGVDLPRLERMLHALADEVTLSLRRDAQASSATLLLTASRIEALCSALAKPSSDLVGVHRSRYDKVGDIELVGAGARQWRTRSGYAGLTVYFWDRSLKNWTTWSESRPVIVAGFDPASRYDQDGPWPGCDSPWHASRSVIRLFPHGGIAPGDCRAGSATRALMTSETSRNELPPAITDWAELSARPDACLPAACKTVRSKTRSSCSTRSAGGRRVSTRSVKSWSSPFSTVRGVRSFSCCPTPRKPETPPERSNNSTRIRTSDCWAWFACGRRPLRSSQLPSAAISLSILPLMVCRRESRRPCPGDRPGEADEAEPEPRDDRFESPLGILLTRAAEQLEAIADGGLRSARDVDRLRTCLTGVPRSVWPVSRGRSSAWPMSSTSSARASRPIRERRPVRCYVRITSSRLRRHKKLSQVRRFRFTDHSSTLLLGFFRARDFRRSPRTSE